MMSLPVSGLMFFPAVCGLFLPGREVCSIQEGVLGSGGSRISPRRGRQLPRGGGAPTYDFAIFPQKLHEIERIWAPRGGGRASKILLCRSATAGGVAHSRGV